MVKKDKLRKWMLMSKWRKKKGCLHILYLSSGSSLIHPLPLRPSLHEGSFHPEDRCSPIVFSLFHSLDCGVGPRDHIHTWFSWVLMKSSDPKKVYHACKFACRARRGMIINHPKKLIRTLLARRTVTL